MRLTVSTVELAQLGYRLHSENGKEGGVGVENPPRIIRNIDPLSEVSRKETQRLDVIETSESAAIA